MKKSSRMSWFVAGVLAAAIVSQLVSPAMAALAGKTIEVFTGVNVYVDDQLIQPKDVNGNSVEVFVYNGTTYLPIRAIGNALGKPVQWEGKTNSAYVGKHTGDKPAVWVKDLDYFVGQEWEIYNGKDNIGTEHNGAVSDDFWSGGFSNTYLISGQYSAISGTLFQKYADRSEMETSTLKIFGDGELLYSADMKGGIKPLDFYVSVAGVLELTVKFETASGSYHTCAAIADFGLWS